MDSVQLLGFGIVAVAGSGVALWFIVDAIRLSHVVATETVLNNDEKARAMFLGLLEEAAVNMLVYDDGDAADWSIYQNESVVSAVLEKLRTSPAFKIDCMFNLEEDTLFKETLADQPGVTIRQRKTDQRRIHYKIIDGRKAYVSYHASGDKERSGKVIDCTNAAPLWPRRVSPALGSYVDDFRRHAVA